MKSKEIRLEYLLSKIVIDVDGLRVGRIEEFNGEQSGADFEIREVLLGPYALIERITTWVPRIGIIPLKFGKTYRIPWDKIDLSDVENPRLLIKKADLKPERR